MLIRYLQTDIGPTNKVFKIARRQLMKSNRYWQLSRVVRFSTFQCQRQGCFLWGAQSFLMRPFSSRKNGNIGSERSVNYVILINKKFLNNSSCRSLCKFTFIFSIGILHDMRKISLSIWFKTKVETKHGNKILKLLRKFLLSSERKKFKTVESWKFNFVFRPMPPKIFFPHRG